MWRKRVLFSYLEQKSFAAYFENYSKMRGFCNWEGLGSLKAVDNILSELLVQGFARFMFMSIKKKCMCIFGKSYRIFVNGYSWLQVKSYADNFKWKGLPKSNEDWIFGFYSWYWILWSCKVIMFVPRTSFLWKEN